jgi:hypothetical protein
MRRLRRTQPPGNWSADCFGWRRFDVSRGVPSESQQAQVSFYTYKTGRSKMKRLKMIAAIASTLITVMPAAAQTQVQQRGKQPIYTITINVVDRTTLIVMV